MNNVINTILHRSLKHCEGMLAEIPGALAHEAYLGVHLARLNVETMIRLEERNSLAKHVTGERAA